jgi:hypothetical protein
VLEKKERGVRLTISHLDGGAGLSVCLGKIFPFGRLIGKLFLCSE